MPQNKLSLTGQPDAAMSQVLEQLAWEDADLPDPSSLSAAEGRTLASRSNQRWNQDLPTVAGTQELAFSGLVVADESSSIASSISALLITPLQIKPGLILYIHGGGFAFCDIRSHERFARQLAIESHCSVLSMNYRLAPEHPFPAGLHDCISVFRQLHQVFEQFPITRGPVAVSGDSAGANLALALIMHEQQEARPAPDFGLLFYGVFGTDFDTPSYRQFEYGPGLTRAKMIRYMNWYADATQQTMPLVAPTLAADTVLKNLPPLYFNAAEIDPLCSDTRIFLERLRQLGRQDPFVLYPGVIHGFLQMSSRLPTARRATTDAANAFRKLAAHHSP